MQQQFIELENLYGAHNYHPLPVVLSRGEGVYVWDVEGNRYLDVMSAYSAISFGHSHPKLVNLLVEQANALSVVSRAFYSDKLGPFLQAACELTGQERALPMNTGAEAVETALKAARKWAYRIKGVPEEKAEIIACENNFHGRTITIVGMSSEPQYRAGFGPFPAGFQRIPYGNVEALEAAITPNTAAFLVEPVQGEGGIIVPPVDYLKKCMEICRKHNVLLICDEVQTGLGRTGKILAADHDNIKPDGVILGKALGGGLLPVSLFLSSRAVMDVFTPGDHGSTFGGNPLAATVGLGALQLLTQENLSERAAKLGGYFLEQLRAISSSVIKEVRGKGLLIGLEVNSDYSARAICLKMLERNILCKETHHTVVRFAPPLIISKEQIDLIIRELKQVLTDIES